ncbi:Ribosomal protein S18 acetylase RimI [Geosmithia morbida]|uniref:Ribosomal protein S18 acetylase RimI n=1 Tax=Geosmithia morbida TaxID=1094350 RepID=A0A9P4YTI3_9HYPO|nr:Ribosomal protein S18 acetylase RimI [Geosmithia morbida]KAF4120734.1 Ribosomal protein S18 acetylase RimI [Geosmithia morbida]
MGCRPASSLPPVQLGLVFNDAFTSYSGIAVNLASESVTVWCDRNLVPLDRSYIFFDRAVSDEYDGAVAFGLMAVRQGDKPHHTRLEAMGVVRAAQGKGMGPKVLETVLQMERERGTEIVELECMQSNTPALSMYRKAGFEQVRELAGWEVDAGGDGSAEEPEAGKTGTEAELQEVSVEQVDALVGKHGADDLAWQSALVSSMSHSERAFRPGHAWCAVSDPEDQSDIR